VDFITTAMWGVVHEAGGTGHNANVDGFEVGGKTGTAQIVGGKDAGKTNKERRENAWFVGFAPYRNPEIVVATIIQNGGWGSEAAAPVAHAVLDAYYKKKIGQFNGTVAANRQDPVKAAVPAAPRQQAAAMAAGRDLN
jgi:penicillin-binding protein 2